MACFCIAGASGFLGLNLVEALLAEGHRVIGISHDAFPAAALAAFDPLPGKLTHCQLDLTTTDTGRLTVLLRDNGVEFVINAAAMTPGANVDPARAAMVLDVNVIAAMTLLDAAAAARVRSVFQPSSAAIYGDVVFDEKPPREDGPMRPATLYAYSKYTVEKLALQFGHSHGLDVVCGRIGAIFGPWERDTGVRALLSQPYQLARMAERQGAAVLARNGRRDWCYSRDVAAAIVALVTASERTHAVYNINCGHTWHLEQLCEALATAFPGFSWRLANADEPANLDYYEDPARVRAALLSAVWKRSGSFTNFPSIEPLRITLIG